MDIREFFPVAPGAPDASSQFIADAKQQGEGVTVGPYTIKRGMMPGNVWIEHESGEGGDFDAEALAAVIGEFYAANF